MTKTPLVNPGLTKVKQSQNPHKTTFFMVLHQTRASQRFSAILTKFDSKLTLGGPKNPNFDLAVGTGWNQYHHKDYQILSSTTIHGSKSKLERPRYHENRDNTLINAPLTSVSYNFWSDHWIFKFHIFLKTGSQDLSRGVKINPIQDHLEVAALEPPPHNPCRG